MLLSTKYPSLTKFLRSTKYQNKVLCCRLHLDQVINLEVYPINQPHSDRYRDLVKFHQEQLLQNGVTTLPGLVTKEALDETVKEVEEKADTSFTMKTDHNIYLKESDKSLDTNHIRNKRLDTKVAALACDELSEQGPLKVIFRSESFLKFVQQILNLPSLHRNVDPVGAVFVNIYNDQFSHNWHFDESQWSTTILLQEAEDIAEKVISGDEEHVNTLEFKPGTLNIFQGRRSLHSVTSCHGPVSRLLGVLHFSQKEGVRNSPGVQELFWGKVVQDRTYEVTPTM